MKEDQRAIERPTQSPPPARAAAPRLAHGPGTPGPPAADADAGKSSAQAHLDGGVGNPDGHDEPGLLRDALPRERGRHLELHHGAPPGQRQDPL